jgi:hypothetical protein
VPIDVMLERVAFGFQQIGMTDDGLVLVSPQLLFIDRRGHLRGQGFQQHGGVVQILGVVPDGHQIGKAPEEMRRLHSRGRLRRHGGIGHEAGFLAARVPGSGADALSRTHR